MFKMSFNTGTLNQEKLKEFIEQTPKPIRYTFGFTWRNPTIHKILISKEQAADIADKENYLDVEEYKDYVHMNAFSGNDMW